MTELTGEQPFFYHWITEREKCRVGREGNLPKPWSDDKILQGYRFCNIRREDDTVSKWIKKNWRDPNDGSPNMVFAMCVARLFNRVSTLELIDFPDFSDEFGLRAWLNDTRTLLKDARDEGRTIWTGAYLVSTNGHAMDKIDYVLDRVLKPIGGHLWGSRYWHELGNFSSVKTLAKLHTELQRFDGMGSFMAGQVVADLKYTSYIDKALDWHSWATIGPGSRRGLNRYFGRKLEASIKPEQFLMEINVLKCNIQERLGLQLHAQDVQNVCCEFDKYCRVKNGEGKPRSTYRGV